MSSDNMKPTPELGDSSGMNLQETELTLGLPGGENGGRTGSGTKRAFSDTVDLMNLGRPDGEEGAAVNDSVVSDQRLAAPKAPATKTQVVGWPPVRSFRKNVLIKSCKYVKVAADGAPYLRKVDLEIYGSYDELVAALEDMFATARGYVATYEDRDGDWMLVGDVPWKMFVESCKRLRLMKSAEAMGFAPRTPDLTSTSSN